MKKSTRMRLDNERTNVREGENRIVVQFHIPLVRFATKMAPSGFI
jgi:hypothetical protein